MEETLTLARVIENINYVYGEKLVKALLVFVLLEIVALLIAIKKKPEWIKYIKGTVLVIATVSSLILLSRSRIQESFKKIELNNTTCSFQGVYDDHGPDHLTWADEKIYEQHYMDTYNKASEGIWDCDLSVVCKETTTRYLFQIVACVIVFLVGFAITRCAFKGDRELLSAALGIPVGAAVVVTMTLSFIVLHIPYHWSTVTVALLLVLGGTIWISTRNGLRINRYSLIGAIAGIAVIVLSAFLKFYKLAGDARWQMLYAKDLVTYHHLMEEFYQVATYGFLGTSLHAFGIIFGGDMLYAYFTVIGISAVAIIVSVTAVLLEEKRGERWVYISLGLGILFLLINFDYLYYLRWVLSNCTIGVCLLAMVALLKLYLEKDYDVTLLIALLSFVVITTRIEGVCYVVLFLSIPFARTGLLKKINIIVGAEIIVWQLVQFVLTTGVGQDGWTPVTGVALSFAGALIIAEPFLIKIRFIERVMSHYKTIYVVLLLAIIGFGFAYDTAMATDNFAIFLSHFTTSKNSNSFVLWNFILLMFPLAVADSRQEENSCLIFVICYILMVFGISIFRTGNPLHTGTSDSFRRVLYQIMPLAVWLVSYHAGKCKE